MTVLNISCVQTTNYLDRGKEYVHKLLHGIRSNMPADIDARYWVITDDPGCVPDFAKPIEAEKGPVGWWHLLSNFKPGMFPAGEQVFFSDLDQIFTGSLDQIARYRGEFAILRDIYYQEHFGSGVMGWTAGAVDHIWTTWVRAGMPMHDPKGDQNWTEQMMRGRKVDLWQDMYPGQFVSFKKDCRPIGRLATDARCLIFHGQPRPHQSGATWVDDLWRGLDAETRAAA